MAAADETFTQASATTTEVASPKTAVPADAQSGGAPPSGGAPQRRPSRVRLSETAPRRTKVTVRRVGIWSVFKFSLLFYVCLMAVIWLALLLIFLVLQAGGVMDQISQWLGQLAGNTQGTKGYVPVKIDGTVIFTYLLFALAGMAFIWAVINTFIAVMYNLISDLIGGVEITLSEKRRR
jgi:hypothetical protein